MEFEVKTFTAVDLRDTGNDMVLIAEYGPQRFLRTDLTERRRGPDDEDPAVRRQARFDRQYAHVFVDNGSGGTELVGNDVSHHRVLGVEPADDDISRNSRQFCC